MASFEPAVEPILAKFRHDPTNLLQILRETQDAIDWISPETQTFIASRLNIPRTQVEALTQFYAHLYDHNRGRYRILFSDNITDRMAGSVALFRPPARPFGRRAGRDCRRTASSAST